MSFCHGRYSLLWHTATQQVKELSIRKVDLGYQLLDCSAPVLLVHDSFKMNPRRKSEWCCHSVPNGDDIRVAKLEFGEKTPTLRKITVQPVPVSMFVGTHPFVSLHDNCATKAVRNDISVGGAGVPVAQHVFFRMN